MDHEIINFVVRDFANRVLYNQTWNLTVTGCYVDIGLNITTLVVQNRFDDRGVVFHYMIAGVENSFPLAPEQCINVRVALGVYSWWITDDRNNAIVGTNGDDIAGSKNVKGPTTVGFGWTTITPAAPGNTYTSSVLDYALVIGMLGAGFAITLAIVKRVPGKAKRATRPAGVRRH